MCGSLAAANSNRTLAIPISRSGDLRFQKLERIWDVPQPVRYGRIRMSAPPSRRSTADQGLHGCLRPNRPAKCQVREGPPRFLQSPRCPLQPRLACCRGSREDAVASPLSSLLDTARQFSRRGRRRNKRAWPAVHIALQGRSLKPAAAKFRERRGQREYFFHGCSRITSDAFLSLRSPRKAGCRISPSLVHSVNFTSPTSLGMSHAVAFSSFTFWSIGFLSVRSGCIVP